MEGSQELQDSRLLDQLRVFLGLGPRQWLTLREKAHYLLFLTCKLIRAVL